MKALYLKALCGILLMAGLAGGRAAAQSQGRVYVEDSAIRVQVGGADRQIAWGGGFNSPQVSMADLNHDGLLDMVTFERSTSQVKTFINKGTPGNPSYSYMPRYAQNFPHSWDSGIYDYLILADYNRDSIMDIFHHGCCGFTVWRGYYNSNNELAFRYFGVLKVTSPAFGTFAAFSQNSDIPGIGDLDGDGDLDFLAYNVIGRNVFLYKNCQEERHLPKDTIVVCYNENCWGSMFQYIERTYVLGVGNCDTTGITGCKTTMHSGNTICMVDMDGDGDMDILDGSISYNDIQYLKNGRKEFLRPRDTVIAQDSTWQSGGRKAYMPVWPAAFWVDVDADGDKDIVISPHADGGSENYRTMALYRNNGSNAAPNFVYQHDTFMVDRSLDFGTASYPLSYDYNRDGRPDLLVGSDGYYTSGVYRSRLAYYQNQVINGKATFVLQTLDLNGTSALNFEGAAPAVGDLDNDGKDDLVLGHVDGSLSFYRNTAASNSVQPVWTLSQIMLRSQANDTINVGYNAAPCIYDLNKDGKKDLIIGHQGGTLYYYRNTGGSGQLRLQKITDTLGGVVANPANLFSGFSAPFIGRTDNLNTDYLLVGNDVGMIRRYTGFQNGNDTGSFVLADADYSYLDVGARSTATVADYDGDGKMDMILGNYLGGLNLYRQNLVVSAAVAGADARQGFRLYPNPAGENISLEWLEPLQEAAQCQIVDATGRVALVRTITAGTVAVTMPVAQLAPGMYQCVVRGQGIRSAQKFIVIGK